SEGASTKCRGRRVPNRFPVAGFRQLMYEDVASPATYFVTHRVDQSVSPQPEAHRHWGQLVGTEASFDELISGQAQPILIEHAETFERESVDAGFRIELQEFLRFAATTAGAGIHVESLCNPRHPEQIDLPERQVTEGPDEVPLEVALDLTGGNRASQPAV